MPFHHSNFPLGFALSVLLLVVMSPLSAKPADSDGTHTQIRLVEASLDQPKAGFRLMLESQSEGRVCRLEDTSLGLWVGNGNWWKRIVLDAPLEFDRDYQVKALITSGNVRLEVNGELVGTAPVAMAAPERAPLKVNHLPNWLKAPTDYLAVLKDVRLENGLDNGLTLSYEQEASRPLRLLVLEPYPKDLREWTWDQEQPLEIEAEFTLIPHPTVEEVAPLVDRYGQSVVADYPGKVKEDADLRANLAEETERLNAWGPAKTTGYDAFGGNETLGWQGTATGFFHTERHEGYWWLISPEGHPLFYTGLDTMPGFVQPPTMVEGREVLFEEIPPKTGMYAPAWIYRDEQTCMYVPHVANMIRKFGPDEWRSGALQLMALRLNAWGFSGMGKWCPTLPELEEAGLPKKYPWLGQLKVGDTPTIGGFVDVFNADIRARLESVLRGQMEASVGDPWLLGWSLGNERHQIVLMERLEEMLAASADTPVKRALVDYALDEIYGGDSAKMAGAWEVGESSPQALYASAPATIPEADREAMRQYFARSYYACIYDTVKRIAPNHLYFGFWPVPGWWVNDEDWRMLAANCDVIGYDRYSKEFAPEWLLDLMRESDKPVLVGEFGFPPFYHGERGLGQFKVSVEDNADAAYWAGQYVRAAAENPYCVGVMWFHYRDQSLTGRDGDLSKGFIPGEHFGFGLVDGTDSPKWDLVEGWRAINLAVDDWREQAAQSPAPAPEL